MPRRRTWMTVVTITASLAAVAGGSLAVANAYTVRDQPATVLEVEPIVGVPDVSQSTTAPGAPAEPSPPPAAVVDDDDDDDHGGSDDGDDDSDSDDDSDD
jgi:hypothetical protein